MLGLDPYYIANEGKLVAFVPENKADNVLSAMRTHPYGRKTAIIGHVYGTYSGKVTLHTAFGTSRILPMLTCDLLPRIG